MIRRLLDRLHAWLIRRCAHPPNNVAADVLEGAASHAPPRPGDFEVQWCRTCGAYRIMYGLGTGCSEWRIPRPEWRLDP